MPTAVLDPGSIEHRLITMRRSVGQLDTLGSVDRSRLEARPATGLVIERMLALLGDLAFAINAHVAGALLGERPETAAAAFAAAGRAQLIDDDLAAALAPEDGPHHVLVQLTLDSDPDEVGAIVSAAREDYRRYVDQVGRWVAERAAP